MIRGRGHFRMPDPLLLLAAAVVLGAVVTTAATAGEPFVGYSHTYYREAPQDGAGLPLARLGRTGGGLHLSLTPPRELSQGFTDGQAPAQGQEPLSHIFLFVSYPW